MKVWGSLETIHGKTNRMIVCAKNQKEAIEILKKARYPVSLYYFRQYFSQTLNKEELSVASEPGVWVSAECRLSNAKDYKPFKKGE